MNTVLIVSDSHGLMDELTVIKERHAVDFMVHCGDSELDVDADELEGFYKVGGNCDTDNRYPDEQLLELGGLTFFVVHGHLHQVKRDLTTLSYHAEEAGASVICFGHTHVAGAIQIKDQLFINPGSIFQSRGVDEKTYAILEWEKLDTLHVKYYDTKGNHYEKLDYKASL